MPEPEKDPRIYFAAERTFLAWIRTGLSMMGFGFVVARFGLFLRQIQAVQGGAPDQNLRLSLWFGVALVLMGVMVNVISTIHHLRIFGQLGRGELNIDHPSLLGVAASLTLAGVGIAVAAFLLIRG
ncbi:MAG: DUF202 domain-containing protein [Acidobacteriota bacterium]|nr:DUF202 domain-containing protein [Acidobacteriota bacterium]